MEKIKTIYKKVNKVNLSEELKGLFSYVTWQGDKIIGPAYEMIEERLEKLLTQKGYEYNSMNDNEVLTAILAINNEYKKVEKVEELLKPHINILSSTIKHEIYDIIPYTKQTILNQPKLKSWLEENNQNYDKLTPEEIANFVLKKNEAERIIDLGYKFDGENKNIIKLDNGKYIYFDFGKYSPNLNFLIDDLAKGVTYEKDQELSQKLNLNFTGDISFIRGRFFISKKGANFFDLTTDKPHVLVKIKWGGSFNYSRGLKDVPEEKIYYRRARSKGGGIGVDYLILPSDYQAKYTLDDF